MRQWLELAIAAMLKPEDQHVYTTPYTFKETSSAIKRNGIPVRYVDIEKNTTKYIGIILETKTCFLILMYTVSQVR